MSAVSTTISIYYKILEKHGVSYALLESVIITNRKLLNEILKKKAGKSITFSKISKLHFISA